MTIEVKEIPVSSYVYRDGWFHCNHDNVLVDNERVYCPDCHNKELTDNQFERIVEDRQRIDFDESDEYER